MKLGIIGFALMIVLMIVFVISGLAFSSMILMPVIIMARADSLTSINANKATYPHKEPKKTTTNERPYSRSYMRIQQKEIVVN